MRSLFAAIYGGIFLSIVLVVSASYYSLLTLNKSRYSHYLTDVSQITVDLIARGVNRQQPQNQQKWLELVSSLMGVEIRFLNQPSNSNKSGSTPTPTVELTSDASELSPLQIHVSIIDIDESWLSATAFLALNEIGRYPPGQRLEALESLSEKAAFPVERIDLQTAKLSSKQLRRIERGETLVVWEADLGQQQSVQSFSPWGNTNQVLRLGPIPLFQPYPLEILLIAFGVALSLIAIIVWLLINHLRKRVLKIQKTVDAIGRNDAESEDVGKAGDTISELTQKIEAMANRIDNLLAEKSYMISAISHDLRTPLAKLRFRVESLSSQLPPNTPLITQCQADINNLNQLIEELLTFEQVSANKPLFESLIIESLLKKEIQDIQLLFPDVEFRTEFYSTHTASVNGHAQLLERLFSNLLTNSAKFCVSQVKIATRISNTCLYIDISDDGPGIDSASQKLIFKPFFKADSARTNQKGGYGLGLAICKQITDQHQGEISVNSPGELDGATFSIKFTLTSDGSAV